MADVEDIVEAVVDIEEVAEEVFEPEALLEDLAENAAAVAIALVAVVAFLLLLVMVTLTAAAAVFVPGLVIVGVFLTVVFLLVVLGALGAFLYVKTDIPGDLREKLDRAEGQASDHPAEDGAMSEEQAIEELKSRYASGELTDRELEEGLDDVLTSDDPEQALKEYERTETARH